VHIILPETELNKRYSVFYNIMYVEPNKLPSSVELRNHCRLQIGNKTRP